MRAGRVFSEIRLVNGSVGDPVLFVDYPGKHDALLFDAGELGSLPLERLADLDAVFITHHHVDHFIGLDRVVRANLDTDKTLDIYGPEGTIRKVYDRVKAYEYQYFPFQKISLRVHELLPGQRRRGELHCQRRFPEPEVEEEPWSGREVFDTGELTVEAVHVDHTVPCLAFALVERPGYHPDSEKIERSALKPGDWIAQALDMLRRGEPDQAELDIQGGRFKLGRLRDELFSKSPGGRVAFVTDTAWSEPVQKPLVALARRADRLYCDAFYLRAQQKQADRHRHMTAAAAADLAARAKVKELILMHFSRRYSGRYHELVEEARQGFENTSAVLD